MYRVQAVFSTRPTSPQPQNCDACGESFAKQPYASAVVYGENVQVCGSRCLHKLIDVWRPSRRQFAWSTTLRYTALYAVFVGFGMIIAMY